MKPTTESLLNKVTSLNPTETKGRYSKLTSLNPTETKGQYSKVTSLNPTESLHNKVIGFNPVDLLFDWFGISCMITDNFCFYLQNRLIQIKQEYSLERKLRSYDRNPSEG